MPRAERPGTPEACAALLRACADGGRTVRVRGGGTKSDRGALPETDVVLETGGLDGIVDHVPEDLTVTVRAGMSVATLRDALAARGQFLPLDPPHVARGATIGGIIAANSNGFGRYRYGSVRDLLLGIRVALPDGTIARAGGRVVKNVAGYDLNKLFVGSFGTLGVVVEATLKILPLPALATAGSATFASAAGAFGSADALVRTSLRPTALVVERSGSGSWRLVVAAAGEAAPVERAMTELRRVAAAHAGTVEPIADPEGALGPLRELLDRSTGGAVLRASLPVATQIAFAEAAVGADRDARVVADAASGIVQVHLPDESGARAAADALLASARVLGGSARMERTLGPDLDVPRGEPGGAFLMRRLKDAFDPRGILEPARTVAG
ncbi:MAG TPA: FAD-binding oxidoreductase [Candidatus Limnocylindria bacterium]